MSDGKRLRTPAKRHNVGEWKETEKKARNKKRISTAAKKTAKPKKIIHRRPKSSCPPEVPDRTIMINAKTLGQLLDHSQCLGLGCAGIRRVIKYETDKHGGCACFTLACNRCHK